MFAHTPKPSLDKSTATPVRRRPSIDASATGFIYCTMMMFMGIAAMNSQANLLFGVFGLMIGILAISFVISKLVLRALRVRRSLPEHGVVGETMVITYEFHNGKRFWPSLSVTLAELDGTEAFVAQPHAYMLHAAAKMSASVPTEVVPKRRGVHTLDRHQISTSFPFGFVKRAKERHRPDTFLIFPALAGVNPKLLTLLRSAETSGAMMKPRRGGDDEFYGVKEYRSGENPRHIYWRRSARTGVLVSREMTKVSPPRLLLLVDTHLRDRSAAEHTAVERTIAMAASLANHALGQGLMVGLYVWSGEWMALAPNRGKRHRRDLLAILARLAMNMTHTTQQLLDGSDELLESGTTPVLFTPRDIQVGLSDHLRSGLTVLSAGSDQGKQWFKFDKQADFTRCMPVDQQPKINAERGTQNAERKKKLFGLFRSPF